MEDYELPDWVKDDDPFLKKWKFKKHLRAVEKSVIVRAAATEDMFVFFFSSGELCTHEQ